jgi:hypothetical protein
MEAVHSTEISVNLYRTAERHIPEHGSFHNRRSESHQFRDILHGFRLPPRSKWELRYLGCDAASSGNWLPGGLRSDMVVGLWETGYGVRMSLQSLTWSRLKALTFINDAAVCNKYPQFRQTVHFAVQQFKFATTFRMRSRRSFNNSLQMEALQRT